MITTRLWSTGGTYLFRSSLISAEIKQSSESSIIDSSRWQNSLSECLKEDYNPLRERSCACEGARRLASFRARWSFRP